MEVDHEQLCGIPRARLYGIISIYQDYLPDFATHTEPLRRILVDNAHLWTTQHLHRLREVVESILGAFPVLNFETGKPARLEVHTGPIRIWGVLLQ